MVGNICSNILGAKQDFCSEILWMLRANILGAKQHFCSNILGVQKDLCSNLCIEATLLFKHFRCEGRYLFKHFGCKARLLCKHFWGEARISSNILGAKQDFCSNSLGAKQDFCSTIMDVRQDFCSFAAKEIKTFFWAKHGEAACLAVLALTMVKGRVATKHDFCAASGSHFVLDASSGSGLTQFSPTCRSRWFWERLERLLKLFEPPRVERGKNLMEQLF